MNWANPLYPTIPNMAYCFFQMMFAIITPALVFSGGAERLKLGWYMIFLFVWATLVYDPIAYWAWGVNGWWRNLGGLDYAGGMPVETAGGFASLAVALALGPRKIKNKGGTNVPIVILGGALLWFGWIGFNAGSAGNASARAANAAFVTNLAGAVGAGTWMVCEYILHGKLGSMGLINGAVAGMVCITPGAGYVQAPCALIYGVLPGILCYIVSKLRKKFVDDAFDAFAVHGVAGFLGLCLNGFFAEKDVMALDGTN